MPAITTVIPTLKLYTLKEVSEFGNGKNGKPVWIIYKYSVYDCTNYLDKHPGAPDMILEYAGRDCTRDFEDVGHSMDAMRDLRSLKIGEIVEEDRKNPKKITSTQSIASMVSTDSEKKRKRRFLLCR